MRFWQFIDTAYYPYVGDPIEADSLEEARAKVAATLRPGDRDTIYLVPAEAVTKVGPMEGPRPEPKSILALQQELNEIHRSQVEAALLGGYSVIVEPGSLSHSDPQPPPEPA